MNTFEELQVHLKDLHFMYKDIRQKLSQWEVLQTVELARAEYEALIAKEEEKLARLKQQKQEREKEKRELTTNKLGTEVLLAPMKTSRYWQPVRQKTQGGKKTGGSDKLEARHRFKKFVNRWAYSWHLNATVLGHINRIADTVECPLGEALVLLDWEVFTDSTRTRESPETHLRRIIEWESVLIEYRDVLSSKIDALETRFQRWLPIWERWRVRDKDEQTQADWTAFITASRHAKQEQIAEIEHEIAHLSEEILQLKAYLRTTRNIIP